MLDRVSVSIALATIIAILAKLALLYREANEAWFDGSAGQQTGYLLLITTFLVFFRGKMMHDDSTFFRDLELDQKFKNDRHARARIKSGLLAGYLSWLCWAPAVYFLERPAALGWWLVVSLLLSSLWLLADIVTRRLPRGDPEAGKRPWFLFTNIVYGVPLVLMANHVLPAAVAAGALLIVLVFDWLVSDTLGPFAGSA